MIYIVAPLENYEEKIITGIARPIEASDAETAIFLARRKGIDEWMSEMNRIADGWYTAKWCDDDGYIHPMFYRFKRSYF